MATTRQLLVIGEALLLRVQVLEDRVARLEQAQRPAARKPAERKQEG